MKYLKIITISIILSMVPYNVVSSFIDEKTITISEVMQCLNPQVSDPKCMKVLMETHSNKDLLKNVMNNLPNGVTLLDFYKSYKRALDRYQSGLKINNSIKQSTSKINDARRLMKTVRRQQSQKQLPNN